MGFTTIRPEEVHKISLPKIFLIGGPGMVIHRLVCISTKSGETTTFEKWLTGEKKDGEIES